MYTDIDLRLATAEAIQLQNAGVLDVPGGVIGADSAALALDFAAITTAIRAGTDVGGGNSLALAINCDVSPITAGGHDSTLEIQLISMPVPIVAANVAAATTEGFLHGRINGVVSGTDLDTDETGGVADDIIISVAHGLAVGTPVWFDVVTVTTGIVADRIYYVIPVDADHFQVANTLALAQAGTKLAMTGDGSVHINFLATVHASTGSIRLFDEIGGTIHGGQLVAGERLFVPIRPNTTLTAAMHVAAGQTLSRPFGVNETLNLVGAQPQRYYALNYIASVDITAGAVTVDLVLNSGMGDPLTYTPIGAPVIG